MKKIFTIIALTLGIALSAAAQPKAIGGRLGASGLDVDYQHYLGRPSFIQVNAGLEFLGGLGFDAAVLYNYTFAQPDWTSRGDWAWYAGAGVSAGVWGNTYVHEAVHGRTSVSKIAIPVQVGLSYTFWFPLQLSVDLRPQFGAQFERSRINGELIESHNAFHKNGLWGFCPTLSVHYAF